MECRDCLENTEEYHAGRLDSPGVKQVQEHLNQCLKCREEYEAILAVNHELDAWEAPLPVRGLARRTNRLLREAAALEMPAVPWWRKMALGVGLPAAAAALLVFAATVALVGIGPRPAPDRLALENNGRTAAVSAPPESLAVWNEFNNGVLARVQNPNSRLLLSNAIADIVLNGSGEITTVSGGEQ